MKIEKVHIKNIKGIKDLELSFKKDNKILDLIVLAGVNGSGKTTILEAIKDFFDNKNINFGDIEKSNVNLKIFFEDFEKKQIEELLKQYNISKEQLQKISDEGLDKVLTDWKRYSNSSYSKDNMGRLTIEKDEFLS